LFRLDYTASHSRRRLSSEQLCRLRGHWYGNARRQSVYAGS